MHESGELDAKDDKLSRRLRVLIWPVPFLLFFCLAWGRSIQRSTSELKLACLLMFVYFLALSLCSFARLLKAPLLFPAGASLGKSSVSLRILGELGSHLWWELRYDISTARASIQEGRKPCTREPISSQENPRAACIFCVRGRIFHAFHRGARHKRDALM